MQPKSEIELQFELSKLSTPWGYFSSITLGVATFGTLALMSGFFTKPDATFDDYLSNVVPLFGGFLTILGVSEVCLPFFARPFIIRNIKRKLLHEKFSEPSFTFL